MIPGKLGRAILDIRKEEWPLATRMSAYFFLVITSFWILKPLKKTLFVVFYDQTSFGPMLWNAAQAEQLAKVLNMGVAVLAVVAFSMLSGRLRRQQLSYAITGFFIVAYGAFAYVLRDPGAVAIWSFYLFGDLFSTLMVATFFAFLNDSLTPDSAKRLFGLVGLGGVFGGFFGSTVVRMFIDALTLPQWLAVTALLGVAILFLAASAGRRVPKRRQLDEVEEVSPPAASQNPALRGARLVWKSPYLMSIAIIVGVYEIVSTVLDFQFTSALGHVLDGEAIGRHIGSVYAFTNGLSLFVQLFLTSYLMRRFGLVVALSLLPLLLAGGSAGFLLAPSLAFGSLLSVTDNALNYSLNQSSKEALYVPTTREEKYQAKAFIDMFVQRFAKALAVGVSLLVTTVFTDFADVRWLSLILVPFFGVWLLATQRAGRGFGAREDAAANIEEDERGARLPDGAHPART